MNSTFSNTYKHLEQEIVSSIDEFPEKGNLVGNGARNIIKSFDVNGLKINIKSFKIPNLINRVAYQFFRKSKAQRSFENATYLLKNNIGTPAPIAYLTKSCCLLFSKSYYVSKHIDADLTFRELIFDPDYKDREKIIREFTHFTHSLHENNILFKDHSPGNTLIINEGNTYSFYLVDLNRMDFKTLSFEERILNFSKLTSKKDMVSIMSDEYSKITGKPYDQVFTLMWDYTSKFQRKFYRKKRWKKRLSLK